MPPVPELGGMKLHSDTNYKLLIALILLLLGSLIVLQFRSLSVSESISKAVESADYNITVTPNPPDGNFTEEHSALADNQQFILNEIQELNLFSQCTIDTNSIRTVEVAIDNAGTFRRVSLITLICPEILA